MACSIEKEYVMPADNGWAECAFSSISIESLAVKKL